MNVRHAITQTIFQLFYTGKGKAVAQPDASEYISGVVFRLKFLMWLNKCVFSKFKKIIVIGNC